MGQAVFAERTASHPPAAGCARNAHRNRPILARIKTRLQAKISRLFSEQFIDWLAQEMFAGAIEQTQPPLRIECKHRHIDFGHDGSKQRGGFKSAQALHAQCFSQRINLEQNLTQRVVLARSWNSRLHAKPPAGWSLFVTDGSDVPGRWI